MTDEKTKLPFIRKIYFVKDFVYDIGGGDSKKIVKLLESLKKITSVKKLFTETENIILGNNKIISPVKIIELETSNTLIDPDRFYAYLFPSDLVRTLTNLAIIFSKKNSLLKSRYGTTEFNLVKKWGDFNKTIFITESYSRTLSNEINEAAFIPHMDDIQTLLKDVLSAYATNKKEIEDKIVLIKPKEGGGGTKSTKNEEVVKQTKEQIATAVAKQQISDITHAEEFRKRVDENFRMEGEKLFLIKQEEFKQEIGKTLFNNLLKNFDEVIFLSHPKTIKYTTKLFTQLNQDIQKFFNSDYFLTKDLILNLRKLDLINSNNLFREDIFDTNWYKSYAQQIINDFLKSKDESYLEQIKQRFITPILDVINENKKEDSPAETPPKTTTASTAVVPTPQAASPSTTPPSKTPSSTPENLTPDQRRQIQYEVAWMYNRAVYEMFTAYGIKKTDIDPALLENLRSGVYKFIRGMSAGSAKDQKTLALMFGSASKRQAALEKFYPQFGHKNSAQLGYVFQDIIKQPIWQNLNDKQKNSFAEFHSKLIAGQAPKIILGVNYLKDSLENILNSDSPVLNKNIQNTLDAMILQYGINNDDAFGITDTTTNNYDVTYIINSMSIQKLILTFGLPSSIIISPPDLERLKTSLINYATYRASRLALHIQNDSLSKGLMNMNAEEAAKLNSNDSDTNVRHLDFTTSARKAIEKNGAETVIGGMEEKKNSNRKDRDKIERQYKTFIPLWVNLSPKEQRIVYSKFDIAYDEGADNMTKLDFIPEFLFFDITTLKELKTTKDRGGFTADQQEAYNDLAEFSKQLANEEAYSHFIRESYILSSEDDLVLILADYIGGGVALEEYPNMAYFSESSTRELIEADYAIQGSGHQLSAANSHLTKWKGLSKKIRNSKAYKKASKKFKRFLGKKLNPSKKIASSLARSATGKALNTVINGVLSGTGIGTALVAANWLARKIGWKKTLGILGGIAALVIGKTLYALTTLGGFVGGVLGGIAGGVGGFLLAGPAGVIPGATAGVIFGANAGQMLNSTSLLGGGATTHLTTTKATTAAKAATTNVFFGTSTATLAPILALITAVATTLYTIFVIQSAFLVPTPQSFGSRGSEPIIDDKIACFKFAPAGPYGSGVNAGISIEWDQASVGIFEAGFKKVASNSKYLSLLCKNGSIKVYRGQSGWGGFKLNANEIIIYDGSLHNVKAAEYTILHESGHVIESRNSGLRSNFIQSKTDDSCYTYPLPDKCNDSERFAEGLALYVISKYFGKNDVWTGPYPFESKYPVEYNWFKFGIFGGVEY